jgi:PPOX class probable F420-dependent enzyme
MPRFIRRCSCSFSCDEDLRVLMGLPEHLVGSLAMTDRERCFLTGQRVGRLATADQDAVPHIIPVCFALSGDALYITIDEKPKRQPDAKLKRLRNIAENPAVAILFDRYDEDWTRLGWVLLHGRAEILADGVEHDAAQALLRARYPQLAQMRIAHRAVIVIRITRSVSWGDLSADA